MIKLYDIVDYKTNVKGYWLNNGKVYIDNVNIIGINNDDVFQRTKYFDILFNDKKQEAIFYIIDDKAFIHDKQGNITILKHCIRYKEKHISKAYLKALLLQHKGLTIYKNNNNYTIEIWKE